MSAALIMSSSETTQQQLLGLYGIYLAISKMWKPGWYQESMRASSFLWSSGKTATWCLILFSFLWSSRWGAHLQGTKVKGTASTAHLPPTRSTETEEA